MRLIVASRNPGKLKELKELAADASWLDLQLAPHGFEPEEHGQTFVENARIKAKAAAALTGMLSVADDSGLIVEALDGRPGIHSARYCEGTDADRRAKLLSELEGVPWENRQAAFLCAMVVCDPQGTVLCSTVKGWLGRIGTKERGSGGFGYDSLFYLLDRDKTAAELDPAEKNQLSHRGQAWRQILQDLAKRRAADDISD